MLAILIVLVVGSWFYRTADRHGEGPFLWGAVGIASFVLPLVIWTNVAAYVLIRMPGMNEPTESTVGPVFLGLAITVVGLLLGMWSAYLVRSKILLKRAGSKVSLRG